MFAPYEIGKTLSSVVISEHYNEAHLTYVDFLSKKETW